MFAGALFIIAEARRRLLLSLEGSQLKYVIAGSRVRRWAVRILGTMKLQQLWLQLHCYFWSLTFIKIHDLLIIVRWARSRHIHLRLRIFR